MTTADFAWIDTPERLHGVVEGLQTAPWVAIDTESNSMFVYREQVCLVQLNLGGTIVVVDTLAPAVRAAFSSLRAGLARTDRPLYLHGGEYDVGCLKRDFDMPLGGVFDTQQAASLLGLEKTGYAAVVEKTCGVLLPKAHAQSDWGRRPLPQDALHYAVDDVVYLPRAAEALRTLVEAAGIQDEVSVQNAAVMGATIRDVDDEGAFWRLKGVRDVPVELRPLVFALWRWREESARAANQPAGRIVNTEVLYNLTRHPPSDLASAKRAGLNASLLARQGERLLHVVAEARRQPPPLPPLPPEHFPSRAEQRREDALKNWRRDEAAKRSAAEGRPIPLQLVLTAPALDYLVRHGADHLEAAPQMGQARLARYGDVLRKLAS